MIDDTKSSISNITSLTLLRISEAEKWSHTLYQLKIT